MKFQILFPGKNKKNIISLSSAENFTLNAKRVPFSVNLASFQQQNIAHMLRIDHV